MLNRQARNGIRIVTSNITPPLVHQCNGTLRFTYMIERGEVPPVPAAEGQQTEQVNVRLSVEEKMAIEAAVRRKGFKGPSDDMRVAALA